MNATVAATPEEKDAFVELAEHVLAKADGDIPKAAKMMVASLKNDKDLLSSVHDELLEEACQSRLRNMRTSIRETIWTAAQHYDKTSRGSRLRAVAETSLLRFPLPDGKMLGEATRTNLEEAIQRYSSIERDVGWKKRWMNLIAVELPTDGTRVKRVFNHESLRDLQKKASRL